MLFIHCRIIYILIIIYSIIDGLQIRTPVNICTDGYFQCANETICVPQTNNCDGHIDCPNGSDEIDCDDVHGDDYYDHLVRKRPTAEHDDDHKEGDQICKLNYNGTCLCRFKDLLCAYRNFSYAPDDLPRDALDLLDFNGNYFPILSMDLLRTVSSQLNKLILTYCGINDIKPGAFYHLEKLKYLHLDNNNIKIIPDNIFQKNNNLIKLSLMYNSIIRIKKNAFKNLIKLNELDLRANQLTNIKMEILKPLKSLKILYLQNNQIRHVEQKMFPLLPLQQLSLMENQIEMIEKRSFSKLNSLINLFLSNNHLKYLKNETFLNLSNLKVLTLNDNLLNKIEIGVFQDVPKLNSLKLERNNFLQLDKKVLLPLKKLPYIYFDRFELCSAATHVRVCHPHGDGISSQEHLLDNQILRTCVWIMGAIGCIGNIIVLLGRFLSPSNNVVHSLYLRNLALSDLLMGIYLFIIATSDYHYRGVYLRYQYIWRHSYICNLCGFLSTLSCESSVLILSLVTWDRFISITQPLTRNQLSPKMATLTLLILWITSIFVALAPFFHITRNYFGDEFYGSNGVCLSLHIHDPYTKGWEYSAAMFIFINTLALIFISYAYLRMINEIKASGVACRSTRQSQERDKVAQRFGIIVLTDSLCWMPIIIVKIIALAGYPINQNLYAWLAIFILPINSALNPILYTITTSIFKKQINKTIDACLKLNTNDIHDNQHSESGLSLSIPNNRRLLNYRGTQTSSLISKNNSWRRSTPV